MGKVVIIVTLTLEESNKEGVIEAFSALHNNLHHEDHGCLQFDVHKDNEKENTYVFVETWESEALLNVYMSKEPFRAFQAFLADKVVSLSVQRLQKIL
ncbi:putative quinol monooxygenase [Sulfurospirillum oryzae]|uniref:putative quinol monooxygenase n=1 Tax=Sulfurospirillum oryzae TaxID=2976535 RepID=UPI0021E71CEF|nr:putative quinol monooxygenase [Sulfurospirillum oryzae]